MDYWQPIIIAALGSAGLGQAVSMLRETGPKHRRLKQRILEWEEWAARVRRWLIKQDVDTDTMPRPPDDEGD